MRFQRLVGGVFLLGVFAFLPNLVFAQSIQDEIADLKLRIMKLEKQLVKQEEATVKQIEAQESLKKIKEAFEGFSIGGGTTFIAQGTDNANGDQLSKNGEDILEASYSLDLEFEKQFDDYATTFLHLETGHGMGVENELKLFSGVNRDIDDSDSGVNITEAWYEHRFSLFTLTFGKIDSSGYIDINQYANDESRQFLGRIFKNSPVIEFPDDNSAGMIFLLEPADFIEVTLVMADAEADWQGLLDNIFIAGQLNIKPSLFTRTGNYRVCCWLNDKEHTKWEDSTKTKKESYGFGISFDQVLTDNLGAFIRYGWQDPDVFMNGNDFSLEHAWSVGLQLGGSLWGRSDDRFAFAFGQILPSDDYKDANSLRGKSEEHLEAYYSLCVNDNFTLSPDLQVIWDPYGGDAANGHKTIMIGGLRAQVDF
ncbi:MAG: carbohydrate porin [Candidatus Omnitrophota bacterium]